MHADGTAVSTTSMAKPGETITLFGTGFGPTNPATPNGQVITTALPLTNQPTFMIGGGTAKVISAALTGAGQYTFQVIVPANSITGEAPIWATVNGVNSPVSMIPVQ